MKRVVFDIDPELRQRGKVKAAEMGVSFSQLTTIALDHMIEADKVSKQAVPVNPSGQRTRRISAKKSGVD